jgi:tetratricopeptide (TPR) repeat protein
VLAAIGRHLARALIALVALPGMPPEEGQALVERAEAIVERTGDPELRALYLTRRGIFSVYRGRPADGIADFEAALVIRTQLHGEDNPRLATTYGNLAGAHFTQGRVEEAEPLFRRALALELEANGPDHPQVARMLGSLAGAVAEEEARELLEEALRIFRARFGDANPDTIQALTNSCAVLTDLAAPETVDRCREAVDAAEALRGPEHPALVWPLTALGRALVTAERHAEARPILERGLTLIGQTSRFPMEQADLRYYLAVALAKSGGDPARALSLARAARLEWAASPARAANLPELDAMIEALAR